MEYIDRVVQPYYIKVTEELKIVGKPLFLLLDCCSVHVSRTTNEQIISQCCSGGKYFWLRLVYVPAGCTSLYQPCDVGFFNRLKPKIVMHRTMSILQYCRQQRQKGERIGTAKALGAKIAKGQLLECVEKAYKDMDDPLFKNATTSAWAKCGITTETLKDSTNSFEAQTRRRDLFSYVVQDADESEHDDALTMPEELDSQLQIGIDIRL